MRLFWHEVKVEQLLFWRSREAAFFTFFLPVIFFLIFGSIYGNSIITKEHLRAAPFLEAGMIGYGVASTSFAGLAISIVIRRESGVLKRLRATPLPPATYVLAVLTSTFVTFLIEAPSVRYRKRHQDEKPLATVEPLVRECTPPGGLVVDPMAGSGTVGEAAILCGRRAVLIERDERSAEVIVERLSSRGLFGAVA